MKLRYIKKKLFYYRNIECYVHYNINRKSTNVYRVDCNFRNGKSLGRLHLRFKYDFDRSDLHVHLIEAHDLAGSDQGGFNDPYVKLMLNPEVDSRKRQTQIYRNESNPFFDQQFKFPVSNDELQDRTLVLQAINTNIITVSLIFLSFFFLFVYLFINKIQNF